MAKKSEKQLRAIAAAILRSDPPNSAIEDGISICSYVSRTQGIELTTGEVDKVEGFMDEINEQRDNLQKVAIDAIVIVDCSDADSMSINTVRVFPNTEPGRDAADKTFIDWVNDARGDNDEEPLTPAEISELLNDGIYRMGSGHIMKISSS